MAKQTASVYNKTDLEKIQQELLEERTRLQKELGLVAIGDEEGLKAFEPLIRDIGDEVDDNVHEVEEFTVNKSLEHSIEGQLRDVEKSLTRLQKGIYGICKYCDNPIDINRLIARPTSSSCVSCKKTLTDEA